MVVLFLPNPGICGHAPARRPRHLRGCTARVLETLTGLFPIGIACGMGQD